MSTLSVSGLGKSFGSVSALDGVELEIPEGTLSAVLGPSGCGKTTLLRIVAGFLRADAGTVSIDGEPVVGPGLHVRAEQRRVGYVPQEGALFPHHTVQANVTFGLPRRERRARHRVAELLELVGLDATYADRRPDELSGGQQQRVALARALAPRPALVLLDEAFASLDAQLREQTGQAVAQVLRDTGATGLLVTHNQAEALSLADRVAVMTAGRVLQHGSPRDVYASPGSTQVAELVGGMVTLPAVVRGAVASCALGELTLVGAAPRGAGRILIRPEQLDLLHVNGGGGPRASVVAVRFYGHDADVELQLADELIVARARGTDLPAIGEEVEIRVHGPVRCVVAPGDGAA